MSAWVGTIQRPACARRCTCARRCSGLISLRTTPVRGMRYRPGAKSLAVAVAVRPIGPRTRAHAITAPGSLSL